MYKGCLNVLRFAYGSMVAVHELVSLVAFIEAREMCSLVNICCGVKVQCAGVLFQKILIPYKLLANISSGVKVQCA